MSNRSLVELNHDYCPRSADEIAKWGENVAMYMNSGDKKMLPAGVTFKHMRHHSEPEPELLGPFCPKCGATINPSFVRSSADSKSVVKVRCMGSGTDELSFHEFTLATPHQFAQFFKAGKQE